MVSEYGHCSVSEPSSSTGPCVEAGLLAVRPGPFGEELDPFDSRAFAVCDHQLAHVYVTDPADIARARDAPGRRCRASAAFWPASERAELGLDHPRSGELIALSQADAWFAYPFWLDDALAPDYARTVDIHRKPGYDPCELFLDPRLCAGPKLDVARRLLQKKLGFRTLFDVVPLDAALVRGSHGLPAQETADRPLLIGEGPPPGTTELPMPAVHGLLMQALGCG